MVEVYARTRADFLNKAFHTNYNHYPKSIWKHPDGTVVWIVRLDGKEHNGWKNELFEDKIVEQYVGDDAKRPKENKKIEIVRMVVNIVDSRVTLLPMMYVVLGIYKLSFEESRLADYRVWRKVSEVAWL